MTVDVAVLGCGISGMTIARALSRRGQSVVVLDDYPAPGGNHLSFALEGLEFDIGAIYFHDGERQFTAFPELRDGCRPFAVRVAKVNAQGRVTPFPFAPGADLPGWKKLVLPLSFAEAFLRRMTVGRGATMDSYVRSRIGSPLYRTSGLESYLERLFGCHPGAMDVDFAVKRLGWIARRSSLRYQLSRQLGRDPRLNAGQRALARRPGGFAAYYARAVDGLRRDGVEVVLGAAMSGVADGRIALRDGEVRARRIISTLPIPLAARLAGVSVPALDHTQLHSLFVECDEPLRTDAAIVYNFTAAGGWKRLTVHSRMYAPDSGRTAFTVEIPVAPDRVVATHPDAFAAFSAHAQGTQLLRGRLRLIGGTVLPYAYPILSLGYAPRREAALAALAAAGIESLGRQGGFDYIPSSAVAVKLAEAHAERGVAHDA